MKGVKDWFGKRGFKSIGLLIGAFAPFILLGFSGLTWFACGGCLVLFVYINWQPLKDLSDVDEKVEEKTEEIKDLIEEKIDDIKRELVGLKKK